MTRRLVPERQYLMDPRLTRTNSLQRKTFTDIDCLRVHIAGGIKHQIQSSWQQAFMIAGAFEFLFA